MRHLLFIIGLMTTASTGQEKPVKGPVLLPQNPPPIKKVVEGPTLPPPVPAPAETAKTPTPTGNHTSTILSTAVVAPDYLKDLERLELPKYGSMILSYEKKHQTIEIRRGVLKAILKIAAGILPHQHGRDFSFVPSRDENGIYLSIEDKALNLHIAFAVFQSNGAFKEVLVNSENLKKMSESEANPFAEWKMSAADERLASMAKKLIGHDNYPANATMGEFEYLLRASLLNNSPDLRTRGVYSRHEPKALQNHFYHVITLKDAQTHQTRGVVGFFHSNQEGHPLIDYITSAGPKAVPADVINTFYRRTNVQGRQMQSK